MSKGQIKLFLVHENVLVWNPNDFAGGVERYSEARIFLNFQCPYRLGQPFLDVCKLREDHRIVGRLVGCLPRLPQQNTHLGLPLQLMKEEAKLLLNKGVAYLVDDTNALNLPSEEQRHWFDALRKQQYQDQIKLYREERKEEMKRHLPKIIEGRKAKKRRLKKSEKVSDNDSSDQPTDEENEASFDVESVHIPAITMEHAMVQLFTETPWREKQSEPEGSVEWNFPAREKEVFRYRVFCDLWEKGYYMTSGCKFGGDFLVYPGDPAKFHASFITVCVPHQSKLPAQDIVAMGRLGSNVKKTVLICSIDTGTDTVIYTSLQWTGIG